MKQNTKQEIRKDLNVVLKITKVSRETVKSNVNYLKKTTFDLLSACKKDNDFSFFDKNFFEDLLKISQQESSLLKIEMA